MPTEEWRKLSQEKKDLAMEKAEVRMKWEEWDRLVDGIHTPTTDDEREKLCRFAEIEQEEKAKVKIYQERGWYQKPMQTFEECIATYQRIDDDYKNNKDLREAELRIEFRKGYRRVPESFSSKVTTQVEKNMEIEFRQ